MDIKITLKHLGKADISEEDMTLIQEALEQNGINFNSEELDGAIEGFQEVDEGEEA